MVHAEARELLELAALEPGGLDRLVARADPESAAFADHLAGCEACRTELAALRRSVASLRDAVQVMPPADLRARTLDYVARVGRPRSQDVRPASAPAAAAGPPRRWSALAWAPAFAAGVVAAALVALIVVGSTVTQRLAEADAAIADQRTAVAGLTIVTDWTLRLSADSGATRVRLEAPAEGAQAGTVLFSSATNELVMVASGLPVPAEGEEYRCWVDSHGSRVPIGTMYRAGELAYWVGEAGEAIGAREGQTFGVSLMPAASEGVGGDVVLVGES